MTSVTPDHVVAEMTALGAQFDIVERDGSERWFWRPSDESMRDPIRRFWAAADLRGADRDMVAAIRRLQVEGHK